jgi:outer membrane biosynthesis protein TonB
MSRSEELPPDLRAALSLVLRQHKSYGELAGMLAISEDAVHDRAHAALTMLAPGKARNVPAKAREQIGEYLLGQQTSAAALKSARELLSESDPAREWALALAGELGQLTDGELPEIPGPPEPAPEPEPEPEPPAAVEAPKPQPKPKAPPAKAKPKPAPAPKAKAQKPPKPAQPAYPAAPAGPVPLASAASADGPPWESAGRTLPSSKLGGGLLLAILLAAVVVVVILIVNNSGGGKHHSSSTKSTSSSTSASGGPKEEGRFTLKPPESSSASTGVAEILSESGKKALFVQAEHIPATKGFFYAIWLYNSTNSALPVSRSPEVSSTHAFSGAVSLPSNAGEFKEILVTKETSTKPTRPGHVVLRGPFDANASSESGG